MLLHDHDEEDDDDSDDDDNISDNCDHDNNEDDDDVKHDDDDNDNDYVEDGDDCGYFWRIARLVDDIDVIMPQGLKKKKTYFDSLFVIFLNSILILIGWWGFYKRKNGFLSIFTLFFISDIHAAFKVNKKINKGGALFPFFILYFDHH